MAQDNTASCPVCVGVYLCVWWSQLCSWWLDIEPWRERVRGSPWMGEARREGRKGGSIR